MKNGRFFGRRFEGDFVGSDITFFSHPFQNSSSSRNDDWRKHEVSGCNDAKVMVDLETVSVLFTRKIIRVISIYTI